MVQLRWGGNFERNFSIEPEPILQRKGIFFYIRMEVLGLNCLKRPARRSPVYRTQAGTLLK